MVVDAIELFSTFFDVFRHFSTLFDVIRRYSTFFNGIRHFSTTLFDVFRHFSAFSPTQVSLNDADGQNGGLISQTDVSSRTHENIGASCQTPIWTKLRIGSYDCRRIKKIANSQLSILV
jgi:hypothetical protein